MGSSGKYILMSDIDLSGRNWVAKTLDAGAEFNGNSYTIKNLTINSTADNQGLFGINSGIIKNLTLSNIDVTGNNYVGGLVGNNYGTIRNCSVAGKLNANENIGGFVGRSATGSIIEHCCSSVFVTAKGRNSGGFSGGNNGHISYCFSESDIVSTGNWNCGGFVGVNSGSIEKSYSTGSVQATVAAGGFLGVQGTYGYVSDCYTTSDVNGSGREIGGFVGLAHNGEIYNSYATGVVQSNAYDIGVFSGNTKSAHECFANSEQPENVNINQTGVTALTIEEMKNIDYYLNAGWDISEYDGENPPTTTWFINEGGLPQLAWEWEATPLSPEPEQILDSIDFQIGANSGENNTLNVELGFSLNGFAGDVTTIESASDTLNAVDELKKTLNEKRSEIGVSRNRIDGIIESLSIKIENLSASHSTIVDTDFAKESATLVRSQILQQATSSLLKQANITQQLALQLLQ